MSEGNPQKSQVTKIKPIPSTYDAEPIPQERFQPGYYWAKGQSSSEQPAAPSRNKPSSVPKGQPHESLVTKVTPIPSTYDTEPIPEERFQPGYYWGEGQSTEQPVVPSENQSSSPSKREPRESLVTKVSPVRRSSYDTQPITQERFQEGYYWRQDSPPTLAHAGAQTTGSSEIATKPILVGERDEERTKNDQSQTPVAVADAVPGQKPPWWQSESTGSSSAWSKVKGKVQAAAVSSASEVYCLAQSAINGKNFIRPGRRGPRQPGYLDGEFSDDDSGSGSRADQSKVERRT